MTGKSTIGKTTLAVEIIKKVLLKKVQRCFAVCPTFWMQDSLKELREIPGAFPKKNVFTKVNDKAFEEIFRICEKKRAPTLIYVDDASAESSTNKGNKGAFSRLAIACNHLNISMVGVFHRFTSVSPSLRDNAEAVISFTSSKTDDVETICKEFNPFPADLRGVRTIRKALQTAWTNNRFCFIFRQKYTGKVLYFSGFEYAIQFTRGIPKSITHIKHHAIHR